MTYNGTPSESLQYLELDVTYFYCPDTCINKFIDVCPKLNSLFLRFSDTVYNFIPSKSHKSLENLVLEYYTRSKVKLCFVKLFTIKLMCVHITFFIDILFSCFRIPNQLNGPIYRYFCKRFLTWRILLSDRALDLKIFTYMTFWPPVLTLNFLILEVVLTSIQNRILWSMKYTNQKTTKLKYWQDLTLNYLFITTKKLSAKDLTSWNIFSINHGKIFHFS